jgi:flagellar hook protein FlgE
MSLYGMMRTGVSGMQGQAGKLSTIADNIANANTTGYKRFSTEFSTLVVNGATGNYNSGGVVTTIRQAVSQQGVLQFSNSSSDLAIDGNGFFVVQDASGNPFLTRAGSFVPDAEGRLVNAAGFYLSGYSYANGDPSMVVNGFAGLEPVTISGSGLEANPSTDAVFAANLPADADIVTGTLPSANAAGSEYTQKSSMVVYDNLGGQVILDIYYTKTAANTWEVAVFDQADAAPGTSFPYAAGPLSTQTISFDGTTGDLAGASATDIVIPVPNGSSLTVDLADMTQLATDFLVADIEVNGNGPATVQRVDFSNDGTVYAQYSDGSTQALFRVPLANVISPDQLTSLSGNVFQSSDMSGEVRLGWANTGSNGSIVSGAVETSNVDIAEELTEMIQSQRNYTANSKVFQTGSDLMDVLLNLKR